MSVLTSEASDQNWEEHFPEAFHAEFPGWAESSFNRVRERVAEVLDAVSGRAWHFVGIALSILL